MDLVAALIRSPGADGKPFRMGLIDVDKLCRGDVYDNEKSGVNADESAPGRPEAGAKSGRGRRGKNAAAPAENRPIPADLGN
jgi:hypothetical protein